MRSLPGIISRAGGPSSLLTGLKSWYPLDETSGTRYDAHGSHDLTDNNTVGYVAGIQGNAASTVAGNTEYFNTAHHADFVLGDTDFTLVGWFYLPSASGNHKALVNKGVGGAGYGWLLNTGALPNIIFWARNAANTGEFSVTKAGTADAWNFLIAEYNSATDVASLSVNNGPPATQNFTGGGYTGETNQLTIAVSSAIGAKQTGNFDEIAIWRRILTSDEKAALYNGGAGMAYPG